MGTGSPTRTEPVMIRTKSTRKFVNSQIGFKLLTLKIRNLNRSTASEHICERSSLKNTIRQIPYYNVK